MTYKKKKEEKRNIKMTATTVEYRASSVRYFYNYSRCCYYALCIFRGLATKVYAMKKKRHYSFRFFFPHRFRLYIHGG